MGVARNVFCWIYLFAYMYVYIALNGAYRVISEQDGIKKIELNRKSVEQIV